MSAEHFDVLIIGAGISGIAAAYHLQRRCPDKRYAILEARARRGGTWDLFRYPGIRSDSDMHTLGFSFHPWRQPKAIADGASILRYLEETATEFGIDRHIRLRHRVLAADWSSAGNRWSVEIERGEHGERARYSCDFLYSCSGYYRYDRGHSPRFPGADDYRGRLIHPQHWPQDLELGDKRVVVIGSGATAVTLVPALAERGARVTMLQRSPSYVVALPARDRVADGLRRILPERLAHRLTRAKNVLLSLGFYQFCQRAPGLARRLIRAGVRRQLPPDYPVDTHFRPAYQPWDQRLCLVPDADLFRALRAERAEVVTDHIERFTADGLRLASGRELTADVVVSATGLELLAGGGMRLRVDGRPVELGDTLAYKGLMLSGVPNLVLSVGYTNISWTLRADLVAQYVCRLLNYMDRHGYRRCTPQPAPEVRPRPLIELSAGYVQRAVAAFPKQGDRGPWRLRQNYLRDLVSLKYSRLADPALVFAGQEQVGR